MPAGSQEATAAQLAVGQPSCPSPERLFTSRVTVELQRCLGSDLRRHKGFCCAVETRAEEQEQDWWWWALVPNLTPSFVVILYQLIKIS